MIDRLKAFLRHPWTVRICQIAIGGVFIYAALPKIGDLESFAGQIHNYRLLWLPLENLLAMTLPWIELVIGLALVLGIRSRSGAMLATGLMAVFMVAIAQAVARDLNIDCGCFGTADATEAGVGRLVEDAGFLLLAVVGTLKQD